MLGSVGLATDFVGDVAIIDAPIVPWGFSNASATAALLSRAPHGTITYVYQTLGTDPALIDELARLAAPRVQFVGHRTLLQLKRQQQQQRRSAAVSSGS
mmetsp:Transcript_12968/g.29617  ORF Transcript_12968/g.29617 Transcript_12968/m.29617 type:complete len:99 (+) Transcript_12968:585-881(+)